jgi:pimeloyl-ACP methyl ester carboxylesterase
MDRPGTGTTWVLLRGLTREAGHWGGFAGALRAQLPGARVLTPDLPGSGCLHRQPSPTRVEAMTEALRTDLAGELARRPVHLLALSLGGMVALDWATRHPEELGGCVLINTSVAGASPLHRRLRPTNYLALLALLARGPAAREAAVLRLTSSRPADHQAVLAPWTAIARTRPVTRANALRQLVAAARHRAPRTAPPVPLLLLCGQGDRLVDPRCSQDLARRWGLPLQQHATAGHDLPLDDGAWVAAEVAAWARLVG